MDNIWHIKNCYAMSCTYEHGCSKNCGPQNHSHQPCVWIPRSWREKQQALMNIRTDLFSKCHNDPDRQSDQLKLSPLQTNTRRSVSCQNKCLYQRERLELWEFEYVETDTGLFWCQHLLFCAPGPCVLWSLKLCMPLFCSRLHFCSCLWIDWDVQSDASLCQL